MEVAIGDKSFKITFLCPSSFLFANSTPTPVIPDPENPSKMISSFDVKCEIYFSIALAGTLV